MANCGMGSEEEHFKDVKILLFEDPTEEIATMVTPDQDQCHRNQIASDPIIESGNATATNKISDSTLREYCYLLSWLREVFETKLRLKLRKLTEFTTCILCQKPINDVFDMVFVEQYHLICLLGQRYDQVLDVATTSDIQICKINLFHSFKNSCNQKALIETCPLFQRFLEYLKSEITINTNMTNITEALEQIGGSTESGTVTLPLFKCRFCDLRSEQEYLLLRHEISHPETIVKKKCFQSVRKDKQMCPYCRKVYDRSENSKSHEEAHERALKFHWAGLVRRTYQCGTLRARRRERLKSETASQPSYSVRPYTNRRKLIAIQRM
ncbi:uncharacterized protein LOC128743761 [Sabethes cyaneus]|uniref:uncharacterized protein LOC128743761 n=1 Tax=Sabethes cyaneus TaxID=53552 RepID=UPI00237DB43D|nr:uncharacterized protein LOC128743761 [Sabethes cyaneus]